MKAAEQRIVFRGIELYHFADYLERKGAQTYEDRLYAFGGLQVTLAPLEKYRLGSLLLTQVEVVLKGEENAVAALAEELRKTFMTAGG